MGVWQNGNMWFGEVKNICFSMQKELGDRLLPCFDSPSEIPFSDINLKSGHSHAPEWGPDSSVSEVSTIQLEFRDLTMLTGDTVYQVHSGTPPMNLVQVLQKTVGKCLYMHAQVFIVQYVLNTVQNTYRTPCPLSIVHLMQF